MKISFFTFGKFLLLLQILCVVLPNVAFAMSAAQVNTTINGSTKRTTVLNRADIGMARSFSPEGFNSGDSMIVSNPNNFVDYTLTARDLGNFEIGQIDVRGNPHPAVFKFYVINTNLTSGPISNLKIGNIWAPGEYINYTQTQERIGGGVHLYVSQGNKVTLDSFELIPDYSRLEEVHLQDEAEFIISSVPAGYWRLYIISDFNRLGNDVNPWAPLPEEEGGRITIDNNSSPTIFTGKFNSVKGRRLKEIYTNINSEVEFSKGLTLSKALNVAKGTKITFGADSVIDTKILPNSFGSDTAGSIIFKGGNTILQDTGLATRKFSTIDFDRGDNVLSGSMYSQNINIKNANIIIKNDLTLDGRVASLSSAYSLGSNTLYLDNATNSIYNGELTINCTVTDKKYGNIVVKGGELDLSTDSTFSFLNLNLTDYAFILPPTDGTEQSYTILGKVEDTGSIKMMNDSRVNFNITQQNPFVAWSYNNGVVTRKRLPDDQINQVLQNVVNDYGGSQVTIDNALRFANPNNTGDAQSIFNNLTLYIIQNDNDLLKAIKAMQPVVVESAEQVSEAVDQSLSTISGRLSSLSAPSFITAQSEEGSGVAAGEENYKYGAWTSGFYNNVNQKSSGENPGFKAETTGVIIGADTLIDNGSTIGMALSYADNKVKHKGSNDGDTSKINTYTMSVYGMQEINDKWLIQGTGLFSMNNIHNREHRYVPGGVEIARGDFKVNAYGLETLLSYNRLITEKILMTPSIGAEYLRLSSSQYKEKGTTNQNFLITKKADNKLDAILGMKFTYSGKYQNYSIIPEVHGNITYDLLNQSPKVSVKIDGLVGDKLIKKNSELSRVFYNLGTGVSFLKGNTEFSIGYDLYLGKKYVGHQSAVKARLNF